LSSAQTAFGKAEQYPQWSLFKYSMKRGKGQGERNFLFLQEEL
jgi:hypothetical protein